MLAINRKALIVDHLGDRAQGLALLQEAARLAPEDVHAQYNIGLYHLKYGDYAPGWDGYECRRAFESYVNKHRRIPLPEWDGGPLAGRTLLVLPEQGLGDEIMFGSCIPELAAQAKHVVVECDAKLEAIFQRSFPQCTVVSRQRTLANDWVQRLDPRPDAYVSAGSLACRFRRSAAAFPQHDGFLKADPEAVAAWRARLDALGPGRKIGLSWQGGVGFTGRKRRSLTLEQLLPILRLPGFHFVSLQYTEVREEVRALESRHRIKVHHWQEAIDDYDQTAALVAALDGVLTVCTAIVHLTGALGRPALVMVPFGPDWRYGATQRAHDLVSHRCACCGSSASANGPKCSTKCRAVCRRRHERSAHRVPVRHPGAARQRRWPGHDLRRFGATRQPGAGARADAPRLRRAHLQHRW